MKYVSKLFLTLFLVTGLAIMSGCSGDGKKEEKKEGDAGSGAAVQADGGTAAVGAMGEWKTLSLDLPAMT